jgi:hypothetical protein
MLSKKVARKIKAGIKKYIVRKFKEIWEKLASIIAKVIKKFTKNKKNKKVRLNK